MECSDANRSSRFNGDESRWSLRGSTALVTGGTRGIGHAIVEELVKLGATVHTCSENEAELMKCLEEWKNAGIRVTGSVCDVSSPAERVELMNKVSSLFDGKLDIYINNAGILISKPTVDYTPEDYSSVMAINFDAAFHLSQLAHPLLKASGSSSIVFISSIAGIVVPTPSVSLYSVGKAAMIQLVKNLACEWAKDGVRANAIAPGTIRTPMFQKAMNNDSAISQLVSSIPLGRVGEPKEIASLAAFLSMPVASYITGQVIIADGGLSISRY